MSLKNATKKENNRVELEVEVSAEQFGAAVDRAYRKNIGKMNVPGFRKGKAPRHLVEKLYGSGVFYDDAMNDVYPVALDEAIKESGYEYVEDEVGLDVVSVGAEGLVFKAEITVKPEVTVGEYKGLKAKKEVQPVTDEDVDGEVKKLQERNARTVTVEDRPSQMGDTVVFDFEGFTDGEPFEGGKAENHALLLGSGQFIPGFEEQLVGKNTGDEFDVEVTFPEDYQASELAGKPAVFKCKLHEIKTKELPEADDEFAKDCSEFDTLEAFRADLKTKLEKEREDTAQHAFDEALMEQLGQALEGDIPEAMFRNRVKEHVRDFSYRLQSQGLELEAYLQYTGTSMEDFEKGFREQAEKQVRVRLALEKIAQLEGISASDEDVAAEYAKMAEQYHMDVERIKAIVSEDDLKKDMEVEKAVQFVKDNAVVEA